jgi:hypothetical protein
MRICTRLTCAKEFIPPVNDTTSAAIIKIIFLAVIFYL